MDSGNVFMLFNPLISCFFVYSIKNTKLLNLTRFWHRSWACNKTDKHINTTCNNYYKTNWNLIHPTHFYIFQIPLETRLTFSYWENTQWIDTVKAAKQFYKCHQKIYFKTHTKITKYFKSTKRKYIDQTTRNTTPRNTKHQAISPRQERIPHPTHTTQQPLTSYYLPDIHPTDAPT